MDLRTFSTFPIEEMQRWNSLLDESATHVPFLRYEYLSTWWQTRGGGEWPENSTLAIVTAHEGERLLGVAPLFQAPAQNGGTPDLRLLGSVEISDYLDLIAREEDLRPFLAALLPFLKESGALADGAALVLDNLPETSPTLAALQQAAGELGWSITVEPTYHSPYIRLPGDWEAYLASIDKKQRHEIRRKMRRAESGAQPLGWYIVEDAAQLDEEIEAFLAMMAQDPAKQGFLTDKMRIAMRDILRCAFDVGCLQLAFLTIGGERAAGYVNFDYLNRLWIYNSGWDSRFAEYSPGWVLLGYLLQWANEHQRDEFDFLRGDEDYKYRFGAVDRILVRATLRG
jgi:CelD/BcsL family acetyltransferase involved in cellulose biosynthesis